MICPIHTNKYWGRDLSVFNHNLSLPRHRWYEFKEGFSEGLVSEAIADSSIRSKSLRILDPFCGSGTTLVTAGKLGHKAIGIEVNPFLAFATRAKCAPGNWSANQFQRSVDEILKSARHEIPSPLEGVSTFSQWPGLNKWLFNRSVLRGFTSLGRSITRSSRYAEPLRLALFASLMDCCNAKRDGKCLRYRKEWTHLGFTSDDVREAFRQRCQIICSDVLNHVFDAHHLKIIHGDARIRLRRIKSHSVDLIVTSPPYLNSFDYSDVYRPELFAGGFVKNNADLRSIRLKTIRSHVQVAWPASNVQSSPMLKPILRDLKDSDLWNHRIPDMVQAYFADMATVLEETVRIVRPSGQAWVVVSTSAYGGIQIPVDLILADVAARNGWKLSGVYVLRTLRAAGQHWKHLHAGAPQPLRESLIVLER